MQILAPRMSMVLWPAARAVDYSQGVVDYVSHRMAVQDCRGICGAAVKEKIKWYQPADTRLPEFISCQACYENAIVGTNFEKHFLPLCAVQPEKEIWSCDLCHPFMVRAVPFFTERHDWCGFKKAIYRRSRLQSCKGQLIELHGNRWFSCNGLEKSLLICEACYLDRVVLTTFDEHFKHFKHLMEDTKIVFYEAADIIGSTKSCCQRESYNGPWYTVYGETGFHICKTCYVGIITTCELGAFFRPVVGNNGSRRMCDLNPAASRFLYYVERLAEAVDLGDFEISHQFVRRLSEKPHCPSRKALFIATWWCFSGCSSWFSSNAIEVHGSMSRQKSREVPSVLGLQVRAGLAKTYGRLGAVSAALDDLVLAAGSGDELPQSDFDWHRTQYGAKSERMNQLMHEYMAAANADEEWQLIRQWKAWWEEVE
ncbi:hypothetical protein BKA67DRAFT_642025 [Truncatella angustata]|uniref:Uncharacterized protein n=1 Tax=Truncatella angustata TaxID=152316 RepID=A0A9P9A4C8_9PEZI|nr:uncharacterized protein BKA67DRAFT_642025 [Truncatella angustata]KAH6661008.1 hypothetical protein BKA67DRAFT_642025 [Truncatella angustata]